jgi:thiamine-phosphate pyrophosphorylase
VNDRRRRLAETRLYLVCDDRPDAFLHAALSGGVDLVQLRIKDGADDRVLAAAERFARVCGEHEALFILNDRPDLVVTAHADGVHIGQDDGPAERARQLVGSDRIIGLSTHTPDQVDAAGGVDYIAVGPVYETPTKPGRPAVGLELIRYAAAHAPVPFFAIGGIGAGNVGRVSAAGAARIAVVRALTEATDPAQAAGSLRAALATEAVVGAA